MWLGSDRFKRDFINGIETVEKIKILGIWFSATVQCADDNIEPVMTKIKNTINSWSQRNLTIKGRITVSKSLMVSQMVYLVMSTKNT